MALTDALQTQDLAAVAFALRHGPTVVPLIPAGGDDPLDAGVWTYRDPNSGQITLLLFSDAAHKPATFPPSVTLNTPAGCARSWACTKTTSRRCSSTSPVRIRCRRRRPISSPRSTPSRSAPEPRACTRRLAEIDTRHPPGDAAHSPDGVPHGGPRVCRRTGDPDRARHEGQPVPPNPPRALSGGIRSQNSGTSLPGTPRERVLTSSRAPRTVSERLSIRSV